MNDIRFKSCFKKSSATCNIQRLTKKASFQSHVKAAKFKCPTTILFKFSYFAVIVVQYFNYINKKSFPSLFVLNSRIFCLLERKSKITERTNYICVRLGFSDLHLLYYLCSLIDFSIHASSLVIILIPKKPHARPKCCI